MNTLEEREVIALVVQASKCLEALTRKFKAEAMSAECQAKIAQQQTEIALIQAEEEAERKRKEQEPKGMIKCPFGFCPICGAVGTDRQRSGAVITDTCAEGHSYESTDAVPLSEMMRRKRVN